MKLLIRKSLKKNKIWERKLGKSIHHRLIGGYLIAIIVGGAAIKVGVVIVKLWNNLKEWIKANKFYSAAAEDVISLKLFDFLINFFYNIYRKLIKRKGVYMNKNHLRTENDKNGPKGSLTNQSVYKNNKDEYSKKRSIFAKLDNKLKKEAEMKKILK